MIVAERALNVVKPEVVLPKPPKQTKLLGATVTGLGTITTVSVQNVWRWEDCYQLATLPFSDLTHVDTWERAA